MASFKRGRVTALVEELDDIVRARVDVDGEEIEAVGFPKMLGPLSQDDEVVLNTTGIDLKLGTGGVAFILWNLSGEMPPGPGSGHIVKMRYTPWQTEVDAVEAQESPHHEALSKETSIHAMPVVACGLHSQVAGVAAGIRAAKPEARIGYLMTDGAALPIAWSNLVRTLRLAGLIDSTATCGHAFGGDLEAVNVFSGLVALHAVARCDFVVASMGPGVVGTDTALGFTAIEQGQVLDAAGALGGKGVACLRLSFADERGRHRGVSHHSITALTIAAQRRATVAMPKLRLERAEEVTSQLERFGVVDAHDVSVGMGLPGIELLRSRGVEVISMGRGIEDDLEFWLACTAAGDVAASLG